jgi:hypothetical protein
MAPVQDRTSPLSDQTEDHDTVDLGESGSEQAKLRWSWFATAEQIDKIRATDLGTLGYLPWELRRQIFTVLIPQPPIDCPEVYFSRSIFKNWWAFDGWAFRPLGSAVMQLWHSERSLLASHHDTRVTSRFDNREQFGQCGRLELRPYFSTCEPRFDCHRSSDIFWPFQKTTSSKLFLMEISLMFVPKNIGPKHHSSIMAVLAMPPSTISDRLQKI